MDVHVDGRSSGTTTASWFEASSTREPGRTRSPSWAIWRSSALTNTSTGAPERTCRTSALDAARFSTMRAESRASNARLASVSTSLRLEAADTSTSSRRPCLASTDKRAQRARARRRLSIWIGSSRYRIDFNRLQAPGARLRAAGSGLAISPRYALERPDPDVPELHRAGAVLQRNRPARVLGVSTSTIFMPLSTTVILVPRAVMSKLFHLPPVMTTLAGLATSTMPPVR